MTMATNKKTNEVELVSIVEGKFVVNNGETTRVLAESTFKKQYKDLTQLQGPEQLQKIDVEITEVETTIIEQLEEVATQTTEVEEVPQQQQEQIETITEENAIETIVAQTSYEIATLNVLDMAKNMGCKIIEIGKKMFIEFGGVRIAKIMGKKETKIYVSPKKISNELLQELIDKPYKGYTLTAYTWITSDLCDRMLTEVIQFQKDKAQRKNPVQQQVETDEKEQLA